jgi:hypothetical protein
MKKLQRLLRYVNGTRQLPLTLAADVDNPKLVAFIDASFACHPQMVSHSGCCVTLGRGFFYVKSSKQKLVTKSSTEAELVALSDHLGQAIWCGDFAKILDFDVGTPIVTQDNMSTIAMVKNGRPTSDRTRHIKIRYFFVSDKVRTGEVKIEWCNTLDMVADHVTKPLQGQAFNRIRDLLMGVEICQIFTSGHE